jgi:hypothetical protein
MDKAHKHNSFNIIAVNLLQIRDVHATARTSFSSPSQINNFIYNVYLYMYFKTKMATS